jgi:integrase
MPDRYRALVTVAAGTGLRQGEVFGLTVPAVDFLRRRLSVDRQVVLVGGQPPHLGPPKTKASYRAVPLPDVVLEALSGQVSAFGTGEHDLIFPNVDGRPIRRTRFSEIWRPAVARAGLPKGTRFHDLRHFYASLLIRHGESVKVVQARLGHAPAAETLDTYSHLWPDSEDRTRAAVDAVLGNLAPLTRPAVGG